MESQIRDALLVLQSQEGDGEAFAALVLRWQGRLWGHACRLTGDRHAADDVLQESWAAVVRGLPALEDADAFPKWVFRIVTHKCHDWIRKQQRHRWLKLAWSREAPCRTDGQAASGAVGDALDGALSALSPMYRSVILLHYFEGFGIGEIALMLSIPSGTVKSRMAEARQRIRAYMEANRHVQP